MSNINHDLMKLNFLKNLGSDNSKEYWPVPFIENPNTFEVFKSINNILYLIYAGKDFSIIIYDLMNDKIINVIKKAHNHFITSFIYYLDKNNKREIFMSISGRERVIKLWNISNLECILNLNLSESFTHDIISGAFLCYKNINYILFASMREPGLFPIKIYDFNKNKVKDLQGYDTMTIDFMDTYYDRLLNRYYIIICCNYNFQSYDFEEDKILHEYFDGDDSIHYSGIVDNNEGIIKLIYATKMEIFSYGIFILDSYWI